MRIQKPNPASGTEVDCVHWTSDDALDLETETCWCLQCGEKVPCASCSDLQAGASYTPLSLVGAIA